MRLTEWEQFRQAYDALQATDGDPNLRQADFDNQTIDYFFSQMKKYNTPTGPMPSITAMVEDWLGHEEIDTLKVGKSWPHFWTPMLGLGWLKLMSEAGYEATPWHKTHKYGRVFAKKFTPRFTDVEVGLNKTAKLELGPWAWVHNAEGTPFFVQADFVGDMYEPPEVSVQCHQSHQAQAEELLAELARQAQANNIYKNQVLVMGEKGRLSFLDVPPCTWADVIMPPHITKQLRRATVDMLKRRDKFIKTGMGIKRAILMEGAPGTGKSQCGRALTNEVYNDPDTVCTILWVSSQTIDGARDIKSLYQAARDLAPTLMVMEDVDLIGKERSDYGRDAILGELLTQMDGAADNRGLITVASTNDMTKIDSALKQRPGRFDRKIQIPLPNREARNIMLARFVAARNSVTEQEGGDTWEELLTRTEGMTGDFLREIVNTAVIEAVNDDNLDDEERPVLTQAYLLEAMDIMSENFHMVNQALKNDDVPWDKEEREPTRKVTREASMQSNLIGKLVGASWNHRAPSPKYWALTCGSPVEQVTEGPEVAPESSDQLPSSHSEGAVTAEWYEPRVGTTFAWWDDVWEVIDIKEGDCHVKASGEISTMLWSELRDLLRKGEASLLGHKEVKPADPKQTLTRLASMIDEG